MEMVATNLSRRKTHPMLLIRSSEGVPQWVSSLESQKLAVGESNFMCCDRNHEGVFEMCDRHVARHVLTKMILKKSEYLFDFGNAVLARLILNLQSWFLRGLLTDISIDDVSDETDFRTSLNWNSRLDGVWFDRGGVSILIYAITARKIRIIKSLLQSLDNKVISKTKRRRYLVSAIPRAGFVEAGITGKMNALSVAMFMSTPEVVEMLLDQGFDPMLSDVAGNDPLMFSCFSNHIENVKYWLKRFPNWDLERTNHVVGGVALGCALYMGPNRLELTKLLLKLGAKPDTVSHAGGSALAAACSNEDADVEVIRLLLQQKGVNIHYRRRRKSLKWKFIDVIAKTAVRRFKTSNGLLKSIAEESGSTALHHAAMRGDMEIVELLLSEGADPSVKNDLGQDAAAMCTSFPELRGVLEKRERKMKLRGVSKKTKTVEVLGKRISTATPIQHEMWLISLEMLLMLYGDGSKGRVMEVHQELHIRGFLTRWKDVPSDSEIIFVSHEWLSWAHPDPDGDQLRVLCHVLQRLTRGETDTDMDPLHTMIYKHKFTVKGKDWKKMLRRTYLWVDWFSMPQPCAVKKDTKIDKDRMAKLKLEGSKAIRSIPAYVERSDFIMVLVPGCHHSDRKVPTSFRSWRRRGWCLLELYAAVMARDSSNPPLLVRSERGTPSWMSPMEILKLSIGLADFTCCQRNHVITTETQKIMGEESAKKIPCDKPIAGGILEQLINAKISHLFNAERDLVMARLHYVFKHWWMRGLREERKFVADKNKSALEKFKKKLRWKDNEKWFGCGGGGLLSLAVGSDEVNVVRELLQELKQNFKGAEYTRRLESEIRDEGYITLGISGRTTTLMIAMGFASPEIISMLLESGANVERVDVMGNDAFMFASIFGRSENLQYWLHRVKDWDLSRQNIVFGGCALGHAVYTGANKLETVKVLLNAGARVDYRTFSGGTALTGAVENEDSDPEVVRLVLEKLKQISSNSEEFTSHVNYQRHSATFKWKSIYFVAKTLYRTGVSKSGLMRSLAIDAGTTPLNLAAVRGDIEIVKILLENDASPDVKNDLGMNAFEICEACGPFPSVKKVLYENSDK